MGTRPSYIIRRAHLTPSLHGDWNGEEWEQADTAELTHFRPESSDHHPRTMVRLLYDRDNLFGIFRVNDTYVRSVCKKYMDLVSADSCVEFFIRPKQNAGYFNFEFNCGGTLLASYIVDPTRTGDGFRDFTPVSEADGRKVQVYHSMPSIVNPEITVPVTWIIEFIIPFSLLEKYAGQIGKVTGQHWSANFYKCGDATSHPHWAAWSPVKERNFHIPHCFGTLRFAAEHF